MSSSQKLFFVLLTLFLFSCTPSTISETDTPRPSATEDVSVKNTPTPAKSSLNVQKEALRGVQVKVWHPWFGAEASLFESQVSQFNQQNEWGILVSTEGRENFSELFSQTTDALKNASNP